MTYSFKRSAGFSLIELMVALAAGLIVVGAVLAFTLSSLRANSDFIRSARLTQELRTSLNFVTDELRRAGYDEDALNYVSRPSSFTAASPFATVQIGSPNADDGCIVYAYDRLPGLAGTAELGNGEIRAIRRAARTVNGVQVGVLEFAESDTGVTPACNGASPDYSTYPATCSGSGWCALSDPRSVNITRLRFANAGIVSLPGSAGTNAMQIRRIEVEIRGSLLNATDIVRGVHANVKVRADCVRANPGANCTATPVGS